MTAPGSPSTATGASWPAPLARPRWRGRPLAAGLAAGDLRRRPGSLLVAVATGAAAGAWLASDWGGAAGLPAGTLAAVLLVAVPAALAAGTDPDQRADAAVLLRAGADPALVRRAARLAAWPAVTASALAGASVAGLAGALEAGDAVLPALLLPPLGARATAGSRLGDPPVRADAKETGRLAIGLVLVGVAVLVPTRISSGFDADLVIGPALVAATIGLVLIAPATTALVTRVVAGVGRPSTRAAVTALSRTRGAVAVPAALVAGAACVLVVQTVVGVGLGRREADRVRALESLGPATAGAGPDHVLLPLTFTDLLAADPPTSLEPGVRPDPSLARLEDRAGALADEVRRVAPGATVTPVRAVSRPVDVALPAYAPLDDVAGFLDFDAAFRAEVGVATPELLAVLGLDPAWAGGRRAVVLDRRVLADDGTVTLDGRRVGSAAPVRTVPAVDAGLAGPAVALPAVLLPAPLLGDEAEAAMPVAVVAGFPDRPDDGVVRALTEIRLPEPDGIPTTSPDPWRTVRRGDEPVELADRHPTDGFGAISVRTDEDARRLAVTLGAGGLAAVVVAQVGVHLAHRREDELLGILGASGWTRVRAGALRGLLLGATGTALGVAVGAAGTFAGLTSYNASGRFEEERTLAPIAVSVPGALAVVLVALPLLSAAAGAVLAAVAARHGRRSPSPEVVTT